MASATIAVTFPGMRVLEQAPATLRGSVTNATAEELDWQPSRERWSISMVLAHLADVEVKGFVGRFRAIATEENLYRSHAFFPKIGVFQSYHKVNP